MVGMKPASHLTIVLLSVMWTVCATGQSTDASVAACAGYPLGPLDQIVVRGLNGEKVNETVTIGDDGMVALPLAGRLQASGKTTAELQRELTVAFQKYIRDPRIAVSLVT